MKDGKIYGCPREPTTAAAWAESCRLAGHVMCFDSDSHRVTRSLCPECADAYARQQVEAAEERLLDSPLIRGCIGVVADLHRFGATSYADAIQAVEATIRSQVEAFRAQVEAPWQEISRHIDALVKDQDVRAFLQMQVAAAIGALRT